MNINYRYFCFLFGLLAALLFVMNGQYGVAFLMFILVSAVTFGIIVGIEIFMKNDERKQQEAEKKNNSARKDDSKPDPYAWAGDPFISKSDKQADPVPDDEEQNDKFVITPTRKGSRPVLRTVSAINSDNSEFPFTCQLCGGGCKKIFKVKLGTESGLQDFAVCIECNEKIENAKKAKLARKKAAPAYDIIEKGAGVCSKCHKQTGTIYEFVINGSSIPTCGECGVQLQKFLDSRA